MSLLIHPAEGDARERRGTEGEEDGGGGKISGEIKKPKKKPQNEIKMSPPLSNRVNIKHCREIYMAVRGDEQNAKQQTPPVTYNKTLILSPPIFSERLRINPTAAVRPS